MWKGILLHEMSNSKVQSSNEIQMTKFLSQESFGIWSLSINKTVSEKVVIPAKAGIQCFQKSLDAGSGPA